jgi:hypothetical protein
MPDVQCCICGSGIEEEAPLELVLKLPAGATQTLFTHSDCLRKILHPTVPFLPPNQYADAL